MRMQGPAFLAKRNTSWDWGGKKRGGAAAHTESLEWTYQKLASWCPSVPLLLSLLSQAQEGPGARRDCHLRLRRARARPRWWCWAEWRARPREGWRAQPPAVTGGSPRPRLEWLVEAAAQWEGLQWWAGHYSDWTQFPWTRWLEWPLIRGFLT